MVVGLTITEIQSLLSYWFTVVDYSVKLSINVYNAFLTTVSSVLGNFIFALTIKMIKFFFHFFFNLRLDDFLLIKLF